jgi:hypothetical protein
MALPDRVIRVLNNINNPDVQLLSLSRLDNTRYQKYRSDRSSIRYDYKWKVTLSTPKGIQEVLVDSENSHETIKRKLLSVIEVNYQLSLFDRFECRIIN